MLNKIIKDYDNNSDPVVRIRVGRFAGITGIIANALLSLSKLILGFIFASISLIADGLNNLSDMGSGAITVVGYSLSAKPSDKGHPYGHARMEYISTLLISIATIFLGIETLRNGISKLINPDETLTQFNTISIVFICVGIVVKILMAILYRHLGKHINSDTLKAQALDSISDVFVTTAVLLSLILTPYVGKYADGIVGCAISVYIIFMGTKLVVSSSSKLLGEAPDEKTIESIEDVVLENSDIIGIHDLVVHSYGSGKTFASVHAEVDSRMSLMDAHKIADSIEDRVFSETGINLVVHIDPCVNDDIKINTINKRCTSLIKRLREEDGFIATLHDFHIQNENGKDIISFDLKVDEKQNQKYEEFLGKISSRIKKKYPKYGVIITLDRGYVSEKYEFMEDEK